MKKIVLRVIMFLFVLTIASPSSVLPQQRQQPSSPGSASAGKGPVGTPVPVRRLPRSNASSEIPMIERDFDEALALIRDKYVEGKKLDYNSAFKSSIIGMLRSLDPHSNYFDREEFDELKTDQRSEYFGIGASIYNYTIGNDTDTFITATFEGSPASRAGLRFGDRILDVDGVKMTGKPSIEVRDKIRGPRGSVVKITVERAADKSQRTVAITRDAVPQPSIPDSYLLRPGVGYIDMTRGFNYTTTDELLETIQRFQSKGITSLVLDLRGNPGGFLEQAIHVAEVFIPSGELILTQKGRNGLRDNTYLSRNSSPNLTPLVILINENTASASEIVAGAMQDHDRALIVGKTSFGKGLVQSIIPLEYGAGLTLTSAKYFTPSGRLIQRDYSNGGFYDYYTHGGSNRLDQKNSVEKPTGQEKKTDTGRAVYGGGGIAPDEAIEARTVNQVERRLISPTFAFARDLVNGRVAGFDSYKVQRPIDYNHDLLQSDFAVTDPVYKAFKDFVAKDAPLKSLVPVLDHNRAFIELQLRFNIVTAAYGRVMADRVFVATDDPQVSRALEVLPRARDLAMSAMRQRSQQ
ncbi:MAG: S41 family peptidase [bacterium]